MAKAAKRQKETPQPETAAAEKKEKTMGQVIYVGPPIKGTLLHSTFTIFADGVPEEYRQHPALKHLFVTPERIDQARKEIGRTGSLRNTHYKRAAQEFNQKGDK